MGFYERYGRMDDIRAKVNKIMISGLLDGEPYGNVKEYIWLLENELVGYLELENPELFNPEELEEMIGEPIYIINQSEHQQNFRSCWEIISNISDGTLYPKGADYCYRLDDYGRTWTALTWNKK